MSDVTKSRWYILGMPWAPEDLAGFTVLAGDEDPHIAVAVCDTQPINDEMSEAEARAVAAHIVDVHNAFPRAVKQRDTLAEALRRIRPWFSKESVYGRQMIAVVDDALAQLETDHD